MNTDHDRDLPLFSWAPATAEVVVMPMRMWRKSLDFHARTIAAEPPEVHAREINRLLKRQIRPRFERAGFDPQAVDAICREVRVTLLGLVVQEFDRLWECDDGHSGGDGAA